MNDYIDTILEEIEMSGWDPGADILAKGYPIYYRLKDTPEGSVLKEYPSGKIEQIAVDLQGNQTVIKVLRREY
jgi:hypothetical protein